MKGVALLPKSPLLDYLRPKQWVKALDTKAVVYGKLHKRLFGIVSKFRGVQFSAYSSHQIKHRVPVTA